MVIARMNTLSNHPRATITNYVISLCEYAGIDSIFETVGIRLSDIDVQTIRYRCSTGI